MAYHTMANVPSLEEKQVRCTNSAVSKWRLTALIAALPVWFGWFIVVGLGGKKTRSSSNRHRFRAPIYARTIDALFASSFIFFVIVAMF